MNGTNERMKLNLDHLYCHPIENNYITGTPTTQSSQQQQQQQQQQQHQNSENLVTIFSENKQLKSMLLLHLDLIQEQSDQLLTKEKSIAQLKQENEVLKQKIDRMNQKIRLQRQQKPQQQQQQQQQRQLVNKPAAAAVIISGSGGGGGAGQQKQPFLNNVENNRIYENLKQLQQQSVSTGAAVAANINTASHNDINQNEEDRTDHYIVTQKTVSTCHSDNSSSNVNQSGDNPAGTDNKFINKIVLQRVVNSSLALQQQRNKSPIPPLVLNTVTSQIKIKEEILDDKTPANNLCATTLKSDGNGIIKIIKQEKFDVDDQLKSMTKLLVSADKNPFDFDEDKIDDVVEEETLTHIDHDEAPEFDAAEDVKDEKEEQEDEFDEIPNEDEVKLDETLVSSQDLQHPLDENVRAVNLEAKNTTDEKSAQISPDVGNTSKRKRMYSEPTSSSSQLSSDATDKMPKPYKGKTMTTHKEYVTRAWKINEIDEELKQTQENLMLEIPSWIVKDVDESLSGGSGTEDLSEETYLKRHQKYEMDERRRKKWDVQRIREQRTIERLKRRHCKKELMEEHEEIKKKESVISSFFSPPSALKYIEVTDAIPVQAFGENIPIVVAAEFSLPWNTNHQNINIQFSDNSGLEMMKARPPKRKYTKSKTVPTATVTTATVSTSTSGNNPQPK